MAGKKTTDAKDGPTRKRTGWSTLGRMSFVEHDGSGRIKAVRRTKSSTPHLSEAPVRVPLTDADMVRIDAICAEPPAVTDSMRVAIDAHRKRLRA